MPNRTDTMIYAGIKAKEKRKEELTIQQRINALEQNLNHDDQTQTNEYYEFKNKWESIEKDKISGIILRSKVKFVEEGEKNSKYFLNLGKRNYEKTTHESNLQFRWNIN